MTANSKISPFAELQALAQTHGLSVAVDEPLDYLEGTDPNRHLWSLTIDVSGAGLTSPLKGIGEESTIDAAQDDAARELLPKMRALLQRPKPRVDVPTKFAPVTKPLSDEPLVKKRGELFDKPHKLLQFPANLGELLKNKYKIKVHAETIDIAGVETQPGKDGFKTILTLSHEKMAAPIVITGNAAPSKQDSVIEAALKLLNDPQALDALIALKTKLAQQPPATPVAL